MMFSLVAQLCPTLCDPMNCSSYDVRCSKYIFYLYFQLAMVLLGCNPKLRKSCIWVLEKKMNERGQGLRGRQEALLVTGDRKFWECDLMLLGRVLTLADTDVFF